MFSQYYPGPPNESDDTEKFRKYWFVQCLKEIKKLNPNSIAFPHGIGAGLAQGNWEFRYNAIKALGNSIPMVTIYKI
jgi:hypothetical protein